MEISRKFTFDAAHHLTKYYGKCERPHGHTYELTVTVAGPVQSNGLTVDFHLLKAAVSEEALAHLDHHDLNEIFENPSTEIVAMWIFSKLKPMAHLLERHARSAQFQKELKKKYFGKKAKPKLMNFSKVQLIEIRLCETQSSCVIYRGQ